MFPIGLNGLHAISLGVALNLDAFKIVGTVLSLITIIFGCICSSKTAVLIWTGRLFRVPL